MTAVLTACGPRSRNCFLGRTPLRRAFAEKKSGPSPEPLVLPMCVGGLDDSSSQQLAGEHGILLLTNGRSARPQRPEKQAGPGREAVPVRSPTADMGKDSDSDAPRVTNPAALNPTGGGGVERRTRDPRAIDRPRLTPSGRTGHRMAQNRKITEAEIEAARTPKGGWTKAQLEVWGVPWPPPPGWKKRLIAAGLEPLEAA